MKFPAWLTFPRYLAVCAVIAAALVAVVLITLHRQDTACDRAGGAMIRGYGHTCVQKGTVIHP